MGAGRYFLGFLIAGPLGAAANFWARYYGWRGTWIAIGILFAQVIFLVAVGDFETQEQQQLTWEFAYLASLALGLLFVLVYAMRPGWGAGWRATYFILIGAAAMIASISGIDALS